MPDRPTSSFSRNMSAALRGYIRERAILQSDVARRIKRSEGYVSERLTGARAPDTDLIDAVALLAGVPSRSLHEELLRRAYSPTPDRAPDPDPDVAADVIVERARAGARKARPPTPPSSGWLSVAEMFGCTLVVTPRHRHGCPPRGAPSTTARGLELGLPAIPLGAARFAEGELDHEGDGGHQ